MACSQDPPDGKTWRSYCRNAKDDNGNPCPECSTDQPAVITDSGSVGDFAPPRIRNQQQGHLPKRRSISGRAAELDGSASDA